MACYCYGKKHAGNGFKIYNKLKLLRYILYHDTVTDT